MILCMAILVILACCAQNDNVRLCCGVVQGTIGVGLIILGVVGVLG